MAYCPECGTQVEDFATFCGNCGASMSQSNNTTTQQPAAGYQPPSQPVGGIQQPPLNQGYQPPSQQQGGFRQPPVGGFVAPMGGGGNQSMAQYMMMKKDKGLPLFLSCICPGLGLLAIDSNRYGGKFAIAFFGSILLFFLGPLVIVTWILGIVWTSQAADEYNMLLAQQLGVGNVGMVY
ncbi:MAG: zinc ribbon domain-containing protein [Candidatus Heimdallarchaeota archaeon]|nr:zinc ribbon domain-containing protein [Candidatus Heimdallarchaeota archaeon]